MSNLAQSRSKRTLLELSLASRTFHSLATPWLLKHVDLNLPDAALELIVGNVLPRPGAKMIKELSIPASKTPERRKLVLSILKTCAPNLRRVKMDLESASEAGQYWAALSRALRLERLELEVSGAAIPFFRGKKVKVQDSVRTLRVFLAWDARASAGPFWKVLEKCRRLKDLYVLFADPVRLGLARFPGVMAKLRSACVHWRELPAFRELPGLQLKKLIVFSYDVAGFCLFESLEDMVDLERLTLFGLKTSFLANIGKLPSRIRTVTIMDPVPGFDSSEFGKVREAVVRSGIWITLEVGARVDGLPFPWAKDENKAEREFWGSLPTVKWVWR